jgi:sulfatase maturation enzyme AslB (radical SAM superfamily)
VLLDIKMGHACNNNCRHCVIEPMRRRDAEEGLNPDKSFAEVLGLIDKELSEDSYRMVVLTGGEPLLRCDFWRIVRRLHSKYPKVAITVQTNGRRLKDSLDTMLANEPSMLNMVLRLRWVISIHGDEATHNCIVQSRTDGNPFAETMRSLLYLQELYGVEKFNRHIRTETVLSKRNWELVLPLLESFYEIGFYNVGISYPHLEDYSEDEAREICYDIAALSAMADEIVAFALKHPGVRLFLECFPPCLFQTQSGLAEIPENITLASRRKTPDKAIYVNGRAAVYSLTEDMNAYFECCHRCAAYSVCDGVWPEVPGLYGQPGFVTPLKLTTVRYPDVHY